MATDGIDKTGYNYKPNGFNTENFPMQDIWTQNLTDIPSSRQIETWQKSSVRYISKYYTPDTIFDTFPTDNLLIPNLDTDIGIEDTGISDSISLDPMGSAIENDISNFLTPGLASLNPGVSRPNDHLTTFATDVFPGLDNVVPSHPASLPLPEGGFRIGNLYGNTETNDIREYTENIPRERQVLLENAFARSFSTRGSDSFNREPIKTIIGMYEYEKKIDPREDPMAQIFSTTTSPHRSTLHISIAKPVLMGFTPNGTHLNLGYLTDNANPDSQTVNSDQIWKPLTANKLVSEIVDRIEFLSSPAGVKYNSLKIYYDNYNFKPYTPPSTLHF